jgi:hypothetical protein
MIRDLLKERRYAGVVMDIAISMGRIRALEKKEDRG